MPSSISSPLLWLLSGCAPLVRVQRALSPESFVVPSEPLGQNATVIVESGWHDELPMPYGSEEPLLVRDGITYVSPVPITDRGSIEVRPSGPGVTVALYARHVGLEPSDFHPIVARSGTLPRALPTVIRFEPRGPLTGPYRVEMHDLHSVYNDSPIRDGDLVMLEVDAPDRDPERYVFRSLDFGWHTRFGAGLLVRAPFPGASSDSGLSPALTGSFALGYRFRTKNGGLLFVNEQLALVFSAGIGSHVLTPSDSAIDDQIKGLFDEVLVGGGLDLFRFVHVLALGNASSPFDPERSDWALALGVDAVQMARFSQDLGARILKEATLREERAAKQEKSP